MKSFENFDTFLIYNSLMIHFNPFNVSQFLIHYQYLNDLVGIVSFINDDWLIVSDSLLIFE